MGEDEKNCQGTGPKPNEIFSIKHFKNSVKMFFSVPVSAKKMQTRPWVLLLLLYTEVASRSRNSFAVHLWTSTVMYFVWLGGERTHYLLCITYCDQ